MRSVADTLARPVRPSEEDMSLARASSARMDRLRSRKGAVTVTVSGDRQPEELTIPRIAFELLGQILDELAQGHAVALTPVEREVSTQTAADVLNVSRPHLIKLLESGEIPFSRVGTHRRIRLDDLLAYKARMEGEAERAYSELVREAQQLGMGYE